MFDPERVLRLLNEEGVAYLVVGGFASNLHGYSWLPPLNGDAVLQPR
ncbi:MAG: hypothetical protein ACYDAG_01555 [Chloroflexota bacterium]